MSSKEKVSRKEYHHGNLRHDLLTAAEAQIEEAGFEALSFRSLAKLAGVSPSAPYRHFSNKAELIQALALRGYRYLLEAYQLASNKKVSALKRIEIACQAYISFSKKQPQLFRLMFMNISQDNSVDDEHPGFISFLLFESLIAAALKSDDKRVTRMTTASIWAGIHGIAVLGIHDQNVPWLAEGISDKEMIDFLIKQQLQMI